MLIEDLLTLKGRSIHTIGVHQSVYDAINLMTARKASALIVIDHNQPVGIFAERDVLRAYLKDRNSDFSKMHMKHTMTDRLISADPKEEIRYVTLMMLRENIRHLPVIKNDRIIGMLVIEDLVEHYLKLLSSEIHTLKDYIEDLHEAGHD